MTDPFQLAGTTALVTGASSGLGRHFAQVLAGAGAGLWLAARRQDALEAVAAATGGTAIACDVTDEAAVEAAFERAGAPEILVNCAGIAETRRAAETSGADWDRVMDTNLKGAFLCARAFARRRIAAGGGGAVVNVASILGLRVASQVAAYAASKAGMIQLTRALALEWARHGIRVNALAPGYIATDLNRDLFASEAGKALIARVPQRRLGQPADLDLPLLLLCSPRAGYITGSVLVADGGHSINTL